LEFVPYPDWQETRDVDIHAIDFPVVVDAILRADRGRRSNVRTLRLRSADTMATEPLSPENQGALHRLMVGLKCLTQLIVYCGYHTSQIWDRILVALPRVETLIVVTSHLFSEADVFLHRRIADGILAARHLRSLDIGSLQTDFPRGRPYNLDVVADAVVARGCWQRLSLEIVPGGVWRDRCPRAKNLTLDFNRECTHRDVNWDWFCSDFEGAAYLIVSGDFGVDAFPVDHSPVPLTNSILCVELYFPFTYTECASGLRRLTSHFHTYHIFFPHERFSSTHEIHATARCVQMLQRNDINFFIVTLPTDEDEESTAKWAKNINVLFNRTMLRNDRRDAFRLRILVPTGYMNGFRKALESLELSIGGTTWREVLRARRVLIIEGI
jgi:hypothetical protein